MAVIVSTTLVLYLAPKSFWSIEEGLGRASDAWRGLRGGVSTTTTSGTTSTGSSSDTLSTMTNDRDDPTTTSQGEANPTMSKDSDSL